mmetsp:Transcript_14540/g.25092  ORF Transcript_14540/g.25092 Transcript_14540/m.25092 type:complete len:81 (-) Transcript_14540:1165-1407(-)
MKTKPSAKTRNNQPPSSIMNAGAALMHNHYRNVDMRYHLIANISHGEGCLHALHGASPVATEDHQVEIFSIDVITGSLCN